ncbi:ankyrin repeat domain-containing protein [Aspergillus tubingensis]|uniref:Uncharacterized protein n=2 Tax=Aspergillus subgen. Circumdati TaxID=2720871 RepID=A0A100IIX0_ASPNG|nr:ankyrin [Aspergillus tubingensis]GAQ42092.1 hypothetical protein AKAW_02150 [Aspergillus niger]GFN16703.1 ankyrin [Aspergillus tubingensis]
MSSTTSLDFIPAELIVYIGDFLEPPSLAAFARTAKRYSQLLTPQLLSQWLLCGCDMRRWLSWKHTKHWESPHIIEYFEKSPSDIYRAYCCQTLLHRFAFGGNLCLVKLMLSRGANINAQDKLENTPLHWAASEGHLRVVQALIEAGADANVEDENGHTPLGIAIVCKKSAVVRYLLDSVQYAQEAILRVFSDEMMEDCTNSDIPIMIFHALKDSGYDFSSTDASSEGYLLSATSRGNITLVQLLLADGSDPFQTDGWGETALFIACSQGNIELARLLISAMQAAGGDPFIANGNGMTPLLQVMEHYHVNLDLLKLLLDSGACVNASDEFRIRKSALKGPKSVFELLVDRAPSLWTSDALESCLLTYLFDLAVLFDTNTDYFKATARILKLAISGRVKVDVSSSKNSLVNHTPLYFACQITHDQIRASGIIRSLLEAGADVDIPNGIGRTPIHNILKTSRDYQDRELILTMIKSSKNINQLNEDGESYLHLAVKYNHPRAVQLLLSKMSKDAMFAGNNAGDNALHYAMETGNTSMIQQLLKAGESRSG